MRRSVNRLHGLWLASVVGLTLFNPAAGGTQVNADNQQKPPLSKPTANVTKPVRQRLPAYFSKVVNARQRQQIYSIQASYRARIAQLQEQLAQLLRQRDREVDLVLTPDQLQQVREQRAAAAARRKNRRASQVSPKKSEKKGPTDGQP